MQPNQHVGRWASLKHWLFYFNSDLMSAGRLSVSFYQLLFFLEMSAELGIILVLLEYPDILEQFEAREAQERQFWAVIALLALYFSLIVAMYFCRSRGAAVWKLLHATLLLGNALSAPLFFLGLISIRSQSIACASLLFLSCLGILVIVVLYHSIHFEFQYCQGSITKSLTFSFLKHRLVVLLAILLITTNFTEILNSPVIACVLWALCYLHECYISVSKNVITVPKLALIYNLTLLVRLNFCLVQLLGFGVVQFKSDRYLLLCITLLFQGKFLFNFSQYCTTSILLKDIRWIDNDRDYELYLRSFLRIGAENSSQEYCLYWSGMLHHHRRECVEVDCQCKSDDQSEFRNRFPLTLIGLMRQHQPDNYLLKLHEIEAYLALIKAYPQAFYRLDQLIEKTEHPSIAQQWVQWEITKRISNLMNNSTSQTITFEVIIYQELSHKLHIQFVQMLQECFEKASILLDPVVEASTLQKVCERQLTSLSIINDLYLQIKKACPQSLDTFRIMLEYTTNVLLDEGAASIIKEDITKANELALRHVEKGTIDELCRDLKVCVVQLDHNPRRLGNVVWCSKQLNLMFGVTSQELVGRNFTQLIFEGFRTEFQEQIQNWFRGGDWSIFHEPNQMVAQRKQGLIFLVKTLAKICPSDHKGYHLLVCMQYCPQNIGLLDTDGRILGLGPKLRRFCQTNSTFFQVICPAFTSVVKKIDFRKDRETNQHQFHVFISSKEQEQCMQDEFFRLGLSSSKSEPTIIQNFIVTHQKQTLIKCKNLLLCNLTTKLVTSGNNRFILLGIEGCRKATLNELMDENQLDPDLLMCCRDQLSRSALKQLAHALSNRLNGDPRCSALSLGLSCIEVLSNFQQESVQFEEDIQQADSSFQMNKLNQSMVSYYEGVCDYTFKKAILKVKDKFVHPRASRKVNIITVLVVLSSISLLGILLAQFFIGTEGLSSYMDIIFADAAVSDNMQLLEMFYGKAIQFYQYFSEATGSRFEYLLRNCQSLSNYLYGLIYWDHQQINIDVTYNGREFYQYIKIDVPFQLNNHSVVVSTTQFMEQYYKAIRQLTIDMHARNFTAMSQWSNDVLVKNWDAMKAMNHGNLWYYDQMGQDLIRLLTKQTCVLVAIFIFISGCKTLLFYVTNKRAQTKINESLHLYEQLSNSEVQECCVYYQEFIDSTGIATNMSQLFDSLLPKESVKKVPKKKKFVRKEATRNIVCFILLFGMLNVANLINSGIVLLFLGPCQQMMSSINALMDSENYQLEALFDLKTYYLYDQAGVDQDTFTNEFLKKNAGASVEFVRAATISMEIFGPYDPLYSSQFTWLLVADICDVTMVAQLEEWERDKCRNGFKTGMVKQGIVAAMSSMQRLTIEAALQLNRTGIAAAQQLFKRPEYEDLDDSIIYMFKIYQITQARMVTAMNCAMVERNNIMVSMGVLDATLILVLVLSWIRVYRRQINVQRKRHGFLLLISPKIVAQNKQIRSYICTSLSADKA